MCDSFRSAKNVVQVRFGYGEASKFTILTHTELLNNKMREDAAKRASIV